MRSYRKGKHMTNEEVLTLVAAVMTSGIKQEGATFHLPETMLMRFAETCYTRGYQAALDRVSSGLIPQPLQK
jgi:hypothetical protein